MLVSPQTSVIVPGVRIVSRRGSGHPSSLYGAATTERLFGSFRQSNSAGPSSLQLGSGRCALTDRALFEVERVPLFGPIEVLSRREQVVEGEARRQESSERAFQD